MKHIKWVNILGLLLVLVSLGCQLPLFASFGASKVGDIVISPDARVWPQKQFEENGKDNAVYFNGFKGIIFAKDISIDGQIIDSADMFPKETSQVWVTFFYSRLKHGDTWGWKWTRDGVNILQEMDKKWEFEEGSGDAAFQVSANPELSGEYFLTLYYKGKEVASGGFYISKTKYSNLSEQDPVDVEPAIVPTRAQPVQSTQVKLEPTTNPEAPIQLPAEMSGSGEISKPSLILSNEYSDPDNLFTVNYPEGWQLSRTEEWQEICMDSDKFVCFHAQISDYPKDGLLSTFMDDTYENFKVTVGDYELINREEILLNGYPAVMFENGYHFKGSYNQGFAVYLINNGRHVGYQIHAVIQENMQDYDLYYETLRQMVYSFIPSE